MKYSNDRILTTHAGALPQPPDLKAMHNAQVAGQSVDKAAFGKRVRETVSMSQETIACVLDSSTTAIRNRTFPATHASGERFLSNEKLNP